MANPPGQLEPIDLRYWPTCENSLSWSSEGLAVATGEAVQVLMPVDASGSQGLPQDSQWRKSMFSVNQFEDAEWPHMSLVTIRHFSIGEELSDSTIISLAWSPPGLGVHRRNVLAILTSNLVLSFWEGYGNLDSWKRTAVVNHHLSNKNDSDKPEELSKQKEGKRIRAFCWIPPIKAGSSIKWGQHLLAIADDSDRISLFRVIKKERSKVGHWSFELLGQHAIEPITPQYFNGGSLASVLSASSRVSSIKASEVQADNSANPKTFTFNLHLRRANGGIPKALSVNVQIHPGNDQAGNVSHEMSLSFQDSGMQEPDQNHGVTETDFEPALIRPRSDFDATFSLSGKIRTRFYGISLSPDKSQAAACVSLHPTEMIEAVMPATQHTLIVFTNTNISANVTEPEKTFMMVLEELLAFISSKDPKLIQSELDRKIIRSAIQLTLNDPATFQKFTAWASLMSDWLANGRQHEDTMDLDKEVEDLAGSGTSWQESCEVCSASIPFSDPVSARCTHGHEFSRCNISLIAIQEPGISKYCAKCGRHFLDIANLNIPDGPSLTRAVFEEFDVCPYCQGKFRG